ncbi:MAG: hypothetical protein ACMXYC_04405, partial [Candidatus Woesearchaeota archaeon]
SRAIRLIIGNTERVRVDTGGNVGIGTNYPGRKLHVSGTTDSGFTVERTSGTTSAFVIIPESNRVSLYSRATDTSTTSRAIRLVIGNTERVRVDTGGNVGIGTDSPDAKLHVPGEGPSITSNSSSTVYTGGGKMYTGYWNYSDILGGGAGHAYVSLGGGGRAGGVFIGSDGGTSYGGGGAGIVAIGGNANNRGGGGAGIYARAGNDGSLADGIIAAGYFDGNGKHALLAMNGDVGIGTTSPSEKLQVSGNIRATGYKSSDGSTGSTGGFYDASSNFITVKNGLIVGSLPY